MDVIKLKKTILTTGGAVIGGGIAGAVTAAMNPTQYHFPQDFGSGKLWKYFGMGALLTLGGMVLHSPWGQKVMAGIQQSQQNIQADQKALQEAKAKIGQVQRNLQQVAEKPNGPQGDGKPNQEK